MNLWWGSVPRINTTYWKIDTSLSEARERAEECKKDMVYRSINFWLKVPISYYKQHFVFLSSANEWHVLQKSVYVFCWTYYAWVSFIWFFFFFFNISKLTVLPLHSSLWIHESMFIFLIVSRYMGNLRIHFIGRQHSEIARAQREKQENMWTWNISERDFTNVMIKVKSAKK